MTMPTAAERRSPVHDLLEASGARWCHAGGAPLALHFGAPEEEAAALRTLALCDLSFLPKLGVRGPAAEDWLRGHQVDVLPAVYDTRPLDGGLIARLGASDFLMEGGVSGNLLGQLAVELDRSPPRVYRVERQDATFVLAGARAGAVLAQLCSLDFSVAAPRRLLLTRVGGVNCAILPDAVGDVLLYRLWVDCTYAVFLWEVLATIVRELGGRLVGAACFYPELG
jgi:sarcosine oxidase subunit gamma